MSFLDFVIDKGILTGHNADAAKMLQESRFFFGVLALRERLITVEQLEAALTEQVACDNKRLIGEIMIEKGWLTEQQVDDILRQKNRSADNQADLLMDIGLMTPDQVDKALAAYAKYRGDTQ